MKKHATSKARRHSHKSLSGDMSIANIASSLSKPLAELAARASSANETAMGRAKSSTSSSSATVRGGSVAPRSGKRRASEAVDSGVSKAQKKAKKAKKKTKKGKHKTRDSMRAVAEGDSNGVMVNGDSSAPAGRRQGEERDEDDDVELADATGGDEQGGGSEEEVTFESLGVCEPLLDAINELGWSKPTDIQRESLPYTLKGRDIIGLAETGSGKTASFAIPVLQALLDKPQGLFALVLAPTRELAFQIGEQFSALGSGIGLKCAVVVGGVDMMQQAIALMKKPHVIVATPGRIVDHLENTKGFHLKQLKFLVLDEADRLLNMDFEREIDTVLQVIPRERSTYLFSATMTSKVSKLQRASLVNPVKVEVSRKYQTVSGLLQQYMFIPAKFKDCYFVYALNELGAGNSSIVFASTCERTQRLAIMLRHLGFAAIPLHGNLTQPKRLGALNAFKSGNRTVLVATDVASRGLDIPLVDVVFNYDVPTNSKDYIHRVGRTARAGRQGRSVTLVTQYDVELFQRIEKLTRVRMDEYKVTQNAAMMLLERVSDAQRIAARELREESERRRDGSKRRSSGKFGKKRR